MAIWVHPELLFSLGLALLLDLAFGELPDSLHPVAWLGRLFALLERYAPRGRWPQLCYGGLVTLLSLALFSLPAYFLVDWLKRENLACFIIVAGVLLKPTFAVKMLGGEALRVKRFLELGRLEDARKVMPSLVSREVSWLGEEGLVGAAVESVAENTCDSFVAPLFYFLLLGVPGALAYRAANALDATIGYHGRYEYLGKFAARLDDGLNFIPARLTGLLLVLSTFLARMDAAGSLRVMLREHARTPSPNAGWPIAAAAGALGVGLRKEGCYAIGEAHNRLEPGKINAVVRLMKLAVGLGTLFCTLIGAISLVLGS